VRSYGQIAKPLTQLRKKKQFQWSDEDQTSFEAVKQAMVSTPVLAFPDFTEPFIVETDASDLEVGAILMQKDKPVAFLSKALGLVHNKLSIYE
jgi:hypothetical protein